jgi:hypothetical protein
MVMRGNGEALGVGVNASVGVALAGSVGNGEAVGVGDCREQAPNKTQQNSTKANRFIIELDWACLPDRKELPFCPPNLPSTHHY